MIVVVGCGVVGQATGEGFLTVGHEVLFVDVDKNKVTDLLSNGLNATSPEKMQFNDVTAVFVSVPTPSTDDGIDLSYLDLACKDIGTALRESKSDFPVIVFRSTMPPGTTRGRLTDLLERASGQRAGADFGVCYNPEYLRAHSALNDFLNPRAITIGGPEVGDRATRVVREIYGPFKSEVFQCLYEVAEFQKYVHNLFNAVKISFFNEMRADARELGIDPDVAFQIAALTSEGMYSPEYAIRDLGPFGGACLPKDAAAWRLFAKQRELPTAMVDAACEVNQTTKEKEAIVIVDSPIEVDEMIEQV